MTEQNRLVLALLTRWRCQIESFSSWTLKDPSVHADSQEPWCTSRISLVSCRKVTLQFLFLEVKYVNRYILFLSKIILIVPSLSASLFPLMVIPCYVFDIWILPMRTLEALMNWHLSDLERSVAQIVLSCVTDMAFFAIGLFLAITYTSNFSAIIHFFITDAIGKLESWVK